MLTPLMFTTEGVAVPQSFSDLNFLSDSKEFENEIFVKVRSTGKLLKSKIRIKNKNDAVLSLHEDEYGISPGQACVFYSKDQYGYKVLGGGWIKK